jgi:hypothetical protein
LYVALFRESFKFELAGQGNHDSNDDFDSKLKPHPNQNKLWIFDDKEGRRLEIMLLEVE